MSSPRTSMPVTSQPVPQAWRRGGGRRRRSRARRTPACSGRPRARRRRRAGRRCAISGDSRRASAGSIMRLGTPREFCSATSPRRRRPPPGSTAGTDSRPGAARSPGRAARAKRPNASRLRAPEPDVELVGELRPHAARRLPGGAGGRARRARPAPRPHAGLGEVEGDARAHHAAADHDDVGRVRQGTRGAGGGHAPSFPDADPSSGEPSWTIIAVGRAQLTVALTSRPGRARAAPGAATTGFGRARGRRRGGCGGGPAGRRPPGG